MPKDALALLFSQTETCISDYRLFKILEEKLCDLKEKAITSDLQKEQKSEVIKLFNQLNEDKQQNLPAFPSDSIADYQFLSSMLKYVRLPLINMTHLVSEVKISGFFSDADIFEALQFQVAKHVLNKEKLLSDCRFKYRGIRTSLDRKHFDLCVKEVNLEMEESEGEEWVTEPF